MYDWMRMIELYEKILPHMTEGEEITNEGWNQYEKTCQTLSKEMREHLKILEECHRGADLVMMKRCGLSWRQGDRGMYSLLKNRPKKRMRIMFY